MKKIASIVGTRPNIIKLVSLNELLATNFNHIIIDTGQHYDPKLSSIFLKEYKMPKPNYSLKVKEDSQSEQIAKMISACAKALEKENPNLVIVYGDTNSTLAGAIAAVKQNIPVVHVEAGIRSNDLKSPEEQNRRVVDAISTYLLCPTRKAVENLEKEGKRGYFVGDLMLDLFKKVKADKEVIEKFKVSKGKYMLATIHRQENTLEKRTLLKILKSIETLSMNIIFPIHPRTKKVLSSLKFKSNKIKLTEPINHAESINLIKNAAFVITDSGGLQKEAYWAKVPCATLRQATEWPETISSGWNIQIDNVEDLKKKVEQFKRPKNHPSFFGDGNASTKSFRLIRRALG